MKLAKQLLALFLCALLLGATAMPAFAAAPQAAAEEPAEAGEDAPTVLISPAGDILSRVEFYLSHAGLFLRMRLIHIVNFFRSLAGEEPILL